ncbi:MAG: hypothetical protein AAFR44_11245 [Pseudomonadota bacterium]
MSRPNPATAAFCLALLTLPLTGGCLAVSAARAAGDVAEGAVRATGDVAEGAVNATGAVAGAIIPGGGDDEDERAD